MPPFFRCCSLNSYCLPRWLPHRRAIRSISRKKEHPFLSAASMLGEQALVPLLRHLLEAHNDFQRSSALVHVALIAAVAADCAANVEALILGANADPFVRPPISPISYDATAVHVAAACGKTEALKTILCLDPMRKASEVLDKFGMTPVHIAAACGQVLCVRLLVHHDPSVLTSRVQRPIGEASLSYVLPDDFWYTSDGKYLLDGDVKLNSDLLDMDRKGSTPLHEAARAGWPDVINEIARLSYEIEFGSISKQQPHPYYSVSLRKASSTGQTNQSYDIEPREMTQEQKFNRLQHLFLNEREKSSTVQQRSCTHRDLEDQVSTVIKRLVRDAVEYDEKASPGRTPEAKFRSVRDILNARNGVGNTPVIAAAAGGHEETLRLLIQLGSDPTIRGHKLRSALHVAVCEGHINLVKVLVQEWNVDVNVCDDWGLTALHYAALEKKSSAAIEVLVSLGANIDAKSYFNNTPLFVAADAGNRDSFKLLLQAGADPTQVCSWPLQCPVAFILSLHSEREMLLYLLELWQARRPALDLNRKETLSKRSVLNECVSHGAGPDLIRALIQAGADPNITDCFESTPVTWGAECSRPVVLRTLLEAGGNPNCVIDSGWYPLHIAAANNKSVECLRLLVEYGADVDAGNERDDFATPLHVAAMEPETEKVKVLLSQGASCNLATSEKKITALHNAAKYNRLLSAKVLVSAGASVAAPASNGFTALHWAAEIPSSRMVNFLLDSGCPIMVRTWNGATALHIASKEDQGTNVVRVLLQRGSDIHAVDNDGNTPLHIAILNNCQEIICVLMEAGSDISLRNGRGDSALLQAVRKGNVAVVAQIISKGGNVDSRDSQGRTALHIASENGHANVMRYLLRIGADTFAVDSDGLSPVLVAAESNRGTAVRLLLEHDIDIMDALAPKTVYDCHSPCASFSGQESLDETLRHERHEECEMDSSRISCAICRRLLRSRDQVRSLHCGHKFHDECALGWFCSEPGSQQLSCPLCRQLLVNLRDESSWSQSD